MENRVLTLEEDVASEISNRCYSMKKLLLQELARHYDLRQLEPMPMIPITGIAIHSRPNGESIAIIRVAKKSIKLYRIAGGNPVEFDKIVGVIDQFTSVFDCYTIRNLDDNRFVIWKATPVKKSRISYGPRHKEIGVGFILVARIEDTSHILFGTQWFVQVISRSDARVTVRNIRGKPVATNTNGVFFEYLPYQDIFDDLTPITFVLPMDRGNDEWFANLKPGISVRPWDGKPVMCHAVVP